MATEVTKSVVNSLIEEIEAIVVEKVYEAQNARLDLFWLTGETLRRFEKEQSANITELVNRCAQDNRLKGRQMGERNLWWAVKIYDAYPTRDFPGAKAASLSNVKKLLSPPTSDLTPPAPSAAEVATELIQKYGIDFARDVANFILNWNGRS